MRYQELIINKLENLDGKLRVLSQLSKQGADLEAYSKTLEESHQLIEEIQSLVEREV